jgi:NADH pyrophosphatase NudC (nudix superfamily)
MARKKKIALNMSIDAKTAMTLTMLGFDVRKLANELLDRVADNRTCPCCGRELKPQIVPRKREVNHDEDFFG